MSIFKKVEDCTIITEGIIKNIISKLNKKKYASTEETLEAVEANKKHKAEQLDSLKKWKYDDAKKAIAQKGFVPIRSMSEYDKEAVVKIMNYINSEKLIECRKIGDLHALIINREIGDKNTGKMHTICTDIFILCRDGNGEKADRVIGTCFWTVGGDLSLVPGNAAGHTTMFTENASLNNLESTLEQVIFK